MTFNEIQNILFNFNIKGELLSFRPIGEGHINNTFLVFFSTGEKYNFQIINNNVFKDVDKLMFNIDLVTNYIKIKIDKNHRAKSLHIIKTKDNKLYYKDLNNKYYRVYSFIDDVMVYQQIENKELFYQCAVGFGEFYKYLDGLDASKLYEVIPDFHNTPKRYQALLNAIKEDKYDRVKNCIEEIAFFKNNEKYYSIIIDAIKNNEIPLRITHNDTKLNNVLFDKNTNMPLCIIDLDTVMPGSILYDFGDAIRFGCNSAKEDETDLNKVIFNEDFYYAYKKGILDSFGNRLLKKEIELFSASAIILTLECGMRFLTDYLNGDIYFKIDRHNQNLDRAKNQIELAKKMNKIFKL